MPLLISLEGGTADSEVEAGGQLLSGLMLMFMPPLEAAVLVGNPLEEGTGFVGKEGLARSNMRRCGGCEAAVKRPACSAAVRLAVLSNGLGEARPPVSPG